MSSGGWGLTANAAEVLLSASRLHGAFSSVEGYDEYRRCASLIKIMVLRIATSILSDFRLNGARNSAHFGGVGSQIARWQETHSQDIRLLGCGEEMRDEFRGQIGFS